MNSRPVQWFHKICTHIMFESYFSVFITLAFWSPACFFVICGGLWPQYVRRRRNAGLKRYFCWENSTVLWFFNSQLSLGSAVRRANVWRTDLLIWKRVWCLKSNLVPGSQEFPETKRRSCIFYFPLCMHEWVCDTARTSSSFLLLLPTGAKQTREKKSLLWHEITGRCLHSFLISNDSSILCHHCALFFLSPKANNSLIWVCLCSPRRRSNRLSFCRSL